MKTEERLNQVEESIIQCETIQKEDPRYYANHWQNIHNELLETKDKLIEAKEQ